MTRLSPDIAADVVAQCRMAAGEIAQAFGRAFDLAIEVAVGEPTILRFDELPEPLTSPGLAVMLHIGPEAVSLLLPEAGQLLPDWYNSAEPTAQSKLTTLAQELGMLVLPEAYMADDVQAVPVAELATALHEAGAQDGAALVPLSLKSGGKQAAACILWPLAAPREITKAAGPAAAASNAAASPASTPGGGERSDAAAATAAGSSTDGGDVAVDDSPGFNEPTSNPEAAATAKRPRAAAGASAPRPQPRGPRIRDLPPYARSLLKIRVPLSVTLAEKKQPVGQILEIGPGSILQFEKSCEEMLDLNVSNLPVARGEAVKVGEKFGLRVTSLILPGERFKTVHPAPARTPNS